MRRRVVKGVALLAGCSVALVTVAHENRPSIALPAEIRHVPAWPAASPGTAAVRNRSGTLDADEFGRGPDGRRDALRRADDRRPDPPQGFSLG
jgi:hypothetical protein